MRSGPDPIMQDKLYVQTAEDGCQVLLDILQKFLFQVEFEHIYLLLLLERKMFVILFCLFHVTARFSPPAIGKTLHNPINSLQIKPWLHFYSH